MLEGSKSFMEGLAQFPERYPFTISRAWKLTIRGGKRSNQVKSRDPDNMADFSEQFRNSVLVIALEESMEEARKDYGSRPPL